MAMKSAGIYIFPWDFVDEGMEELLERLQGLGLTRLYLTSAYHAGFFVFPHNPKRTVHLLEDGVTYFHPDPDAYTATPLKPQIASICRTNDWFGTICEAAQRRGVEISAWTVCLHNTRLGLLHPECTIQNAFGDAYPHAMSPAHPAAREHVRALVADLAERYPLHSVLIEAPDYRRRVHGGTWVSGHHHERSGVHLRALEEHLLNLSFNPEDVRRATDSGVDVETLRSAVHDHLRSYLQASPDTPPSLSQTVDEFRERVPELVAYEAHFRKMERELIDLLGTEVHSRGVKLIGAAGHPAVDIALAGAYGEPADRVVDIVRQARASADQKELLVSVRMGFNSPGMGRPILSETEMKAVVRSAVSGGADALGFYNYGEAPQRSVEWIGPALRLD